jgi:hypothetical protein
MMQTRSSASPGEHSPSFWQPPQLPHEHWLSHARVRVPHRPQLSRSTWLGAQGFSSIHDENGAHLQPPSASTQVRDCVPHEPQGCFSMSFGMQTVCVHSSSIQVQVGVHSAF